MKLKTIKRKPLISLNKTSIIYLKKKFKVKSFKTNLSLSDEKHYSIAYVIIEKRWLKKSTVIENLKTLIYALVIAIIIRSLILQPFYIPSSSMELNLLVGDRLFVTKYSMDIANIHFHLVHQYFKEEF